MSNIAAITPLENIPVVDADLKKLKGDMTVTKYGFTDQADFSEIIKAVKQQLHNQIQTKSGLSDEQMLFVKDTQLETMKRKIVFESIAEIMRQNNRTDATDSYQRKADRTPIEYVYDSDEDNVQDSGEISDVPAVLFGR